MKVTDPMPMSPASMTKEPRLPSLPREALDRVGIMLSVICGIHCLFLPAILLALPLAEEWAFDWMRHDVTHVLIFAVAFPVATVTLMRSYIKYRLTKPLILGAIGIGILAMGMALDGGAAHRFDLAISLGGSAFLLMAHMMNLRYCRGHA